MNLTIPDSGVSFSITYRHIAASVLAALTRHFTHFLTTETFQSGLIIIVQPETRMEGSFCAISPQVYEEGKKLHIRHDGLFTGYVDFSTPRLTGEFRCSPEYMHLFTLIRLFGLLLVIHRGGVAIHASAVRINKKGYVFFGNQGDGKSTISRLSGGTILADDTALIFKKGRNFVVAATPFDPKLQYPAPGSAPLTRCVRVIHTKQSDMWCRMLERGRAGMLLGYVRPDIGFFSRSPAFLGKIFSHIVTFGTVFDMFYTLDFSRSNKFLQLLESKSDVYL